MSFKSGISVDNNSLKFLELKKYLISKTGSNGLNCLSVDNNRQMVFVLNENNLIVIQLNHLLSFEWKKSVINEISQHFQHLTIGLNFSSHFISLSAKGFGNKLAICGTDDPNGSPFVVFFDLNDIYKNQNKSCHYSRINLMTSSGLVSDIVWHPEICDNQFGCCVTDGSVYIISIGDIESKTTAILAHIPAPNNSMCLCWSPKGKQLVVGHRNGFFSQYKLIDGKQLQEVKKTALINGLNDHNVIAIKWIVSSLFVMAVTKDISNTEKDTHLLLVSTPSKALPQFVDFGAVCMDSPDVRDWYRINLIHFQNLIICSTSMASEVAVIGCDADKDISLPDNWTQWLLEDSSRIDLPIDSAGNETYLRGLVVAKGTQNTYRISLNETYGGVDCPVLMIYNSSGVLVPYLMIDRTGRLRGPIAPNVVKPTVVASPLPQPKPITSTPILSANNGPQPKLVPKANTSSFGSPLTPVVSSGNTISRPEASPLPSAKHMFQPTTQSISPQTIGSELKSTESKGQTTKSSSAEDTTVATNELYLNAIKEQIKEFNKVMNETKKKYSKIRVKIGEKEEQMKLKNETRLLEEVLPEIQNNFKSCSKDTTTLQSSLIESFSLVEEAKSITDRNVDPKYRHLLKQRALDPITGRRMQEIHSLNEYIEIQLRELDAKFEQEWYEWLEQRKGLKTKQPNRIQANTTLELIYKALANNQRVVNTLRLHLDQLEGMASPSRLKPKTRIIKDPNNENMNKKIIDNLSKNLSKSSIKDIVSEDIPIDRVFKLKTISNEKKTNLLNFFENRTKVPVRRSVDNSSHFVSAIEKLKEKQKKLDSIRLSPTKVDSIVNKTTEDKPKQTLSSTDNRVSITPTVVNVHKTMSKEVPKTPVEKPIPEKKLEEKLPNLTLLLRNESNKQSISDSNKTIESKSTEIFQSFASKPLSFNLSSTPVISTTPKSISTPVPTFAPKLQSSTPILSSLISSKSKPELDLSKKETESASTASYVSKTVSFGNTTIINPIDTSVDNDFKLDTISELSESNESTFAANSPFTAFKGFGNQSTDSPFPKLSFNLSANQSNSSFNLTGDSVSGAKDSLPKYEDISPPTTPQKSVPVVETKAVINESPVITESETSKPFSILKTALSTKTAEQIDHKSPETPSLPKITTTITPIELPVPSITSVTTTASITPSKSTTPSTTPNTPFITQTTTTAPKPSNEPKPQITSNSEQISSPFGGQGFGQTPFSSNSFSFGNIAQNNTTQTVPAFGSGLSFGGTTGFGVNQTIPVSNVSTAPLAFGQQNTGLNNLAFCGLGGPPSAENANKNAFGGAFSSPPLQTSPQAFTPTSQTSPFGVKSAVGGFGGSFSSGSGVAQTGFAAFQSSSQQQSPQQTQQSVFGGSPVFGSAQQPAFGGSPTFGGSPQQTAFGSAPTFGGAPVMGSMASNAFGAQNTGAFTANNSFVNPSNTGLSFGALASTAQSPQQQQQPQQQNTAPFGSGFSGFGSSDNFSFTQRRK